MELKFSNDYNLLNIALGPHKLTYDLDVLDLPEHLGVDTASGCDDPHWYFIYPCTLLLCSLFSGYHTVRMYLFLSNLAEMTSPKEFLVLHLAAKDFLRTICFLLSSGHLKLLFSYLYNRN